MIIQDSRYLDLRWVIRVHYPSLKSQSNRSEIFKLIFCPLPDYIIEIIKREIATHSGVCMSKLFRHPSWKASQVNKFFPFIGNSFAEKLDPRHFFFAASLVSYVAFVCHYLFLVCPSEGLYFVIVAFHLYIHLNFCILVCRKANMGRQGSVFLF